MPLLRKLCNQQPLFFPFQWFAARWWTHLSQDHLHIRTSLGATCLSKEGSWWMLRKDMPSTLWQSQKSSLGLLSFPSREVNRAFKGFFPSFGGLLSSTNRAWVEVTKYRHPKWLQHPKRSQYMEACKCLFLKTLTTHRILVALVFWLETWRQQWDIYWGKNPANLWGQLDRISSSLSSSCYDTSYWIFAFFHSSIWARDC